MDLQMFLITITEKDNFNKSKNKIWNFCEKNEYDVELTKQKKETIQDWGPSQVYF